MRIRVKQRPRTEHRRACREGLGEYERLPGSRHPFKAALEMIAKLDAARALPTTEEQHAAFTAIRPLEHRGHAKAKYAHLRRSSKTEAQLSRSKYDPRECAARGCR